MIATTIMISTRVNPFWFSGGVFIILQFTFLVALDMPSYRRSNGGRAGEERGRSVNLVQLSRVIEIRPFRGGWECFESEGVAPYWLGEKAKHDAIGYGACRAKLNADFRPFGKQFVQATAAEASWQPPWTKTPRPQRPHDGCQLGQHYSNYGVALQSDLRLIRVSGFFGPCVGTRLNFPLSFRPFSNFRKRFAVLRRGFDDLRKSLSSTF